MQHLKQLTIVIITGLISVTSIWSQGTTIMDPSVYNTWKRITNSAISTNGEWVTYGLEVERGDKILKLHHTQTGEEYSFDRAEHAQIDYENHALYVIIKPAEDSICLLYTSPSPRDKRQSRMPSSA